MGQKLKMISTHVAKYYYPSCVWLTIVRQSSKSLWSSICHARTQHCLGTGNTISFWKDRWHDCGILSMWFFLVCFVSLVLLIFLLLKCGLLVLRLGTCTVDVILLIIRFINGYLCRLFCLLADFIWCLIHGLLTPHLCLLWNLDWWLNKRSRAFIKGFLFDHLEDHFWKKINFFLWELSHKVLNIVDHL